MKISHPNYISIALYRLSGLAFVITAICLVAVVLMGIALSQQQPILVAVDDQGKLHGYVEYLDPATRSDQEISLAMTQFIKSYLSVNSATIAADMQLALSMMAVDMAEQERKKLIASNKIAIIQESQLSGRVLIDQLQIEQRRAEVVDVAIKGQIHANQKRRTFSVLLQADIVPRSTHNTLGLRVRRIEDL